MLSKALLPIGNKPIINIVLDWILKSGLLGKYTSSSQEDSPDVQKSSSLSPRPTTRPCRITSPKTTRPPPTRG